MRRWILSAPERDGPRLDKWLWAARFFRSRPLAAEAVAGGKVKVNGERAKPAKLLHVGDELLVQIGPFEHRIRVRGLSRRRGPASAAALMYDEGAASKAARETLRTRLAAERVHFVHGAGRPDKHDRRERIRFKKGIGNES